MAFNTILYQNQYNYSEKINIIDSPSGVLFIQPKLTSSVYLLRITNRVLIKFLPYINVCNENLNNVYIDCLVIIESVNDNIPVIFDTDIKWNIWGNDITNLRTVLNTYYICSLFSYDGGYHWNGNVLGEYKFDENNTYILTPSIYTCSWAERVSLKNPRVLSSPFELNAPSNLFPHISSSWKLCSDLAGINIIDKTDHSITDLVFHEFDNSKLIEDNYYYAFVRYFSTTKSSHWSNPIKIWIRNRQMVNPNNYDKTIFDVVYYSDIKVYHWFNPNIITQWIETNSNNPDIIDVIDSNLSKSCTILANQHIEVNGIQGLLTELKITFETSAVCEIRLIPDNNTPDAVEASGFFLYCNPDLNIPTNYINYTYNSVVFNNLNLWIYTRLKIIFEKNCVIKHIDFTLI